MLRGFYNMLTDPYTDERSFSRLRDQVVEYNLGIIDQWLSRGVDAVFFSDDWRRLYKPSYTRMFERVRSGGAHVWMHLCGDVTAILPDLIEIGLNVLNPVQPQAMDVRQLSREFGGKVCFNGGVHVAIARSGFPDSTEQGMNARPGYLRAQSRDGGCVRVFVLTRMIPARYCPSC